MRQDVLAFLVRSDTAPTPCADVAAWFPGYARIAEAWAHPMDRAIAGGFCADRTGWAFASGYQAALHALIPDAPADRVCAFCVTESGGNAPRAIATTLTRDNGGWRLSGAKRWTTLGPNGALFFVAARDAGALGERVSLRLVAVPSDAPGVVVETMPETRFVPEVPHAQLRFDAVLLPEGALLPGDGYDTYVKPFRTVEDLHVNAAIVAYLMREALRLAWPSAWIERSLAQLETLRALAARDPSAPATHLALAGALAGSAALLGEADVLWKAGRDDIGAARWTRDRELLGTAGKARAMRTQRAWERISN